MDNYVGVRTDFVQPGNPRRNAYFDRYKRTVCYDWLGPHLFTSQDELQN